MRALSEQTSEDLHVCGCSCVHVQHTARGGADQSVLQGEVGQKAPCTISDLDTSGWGCTCLQGGVKVCTVNSQPKNTFSLFCKPTADSTAHVH